MTLTGPYSRYRFQTDPISQIILAGLVSQLVHVSETIILTEFISYIKHNRPRLISKITILTGLYLIDKNLEKTNGHIMVLSGP